ncbi:SNF2 domain-containing protein / helicase domain-containing protein / F-box family protein isoform X2 [Wolffia australiana]
MGTGDGETDSGEEERKLCGFLRLVVSVGELASGHPHRKRSPDLGVSCSLSAGRLVSEDGIVLSPIDDCSERSPEPPLKLENSRKRKKKSLFSCFQGKRRRRQPPPATPVLRRKKGNAGLAHRGGSVVSQLVALIGNGCVSVECRVVGVAAKGEDDIRVVVLVDVYLPVAAWSGWQFPRFGRMAASLFRHLSCDWKIRDSFLNFHSSENSMLLNDESVWHDSECNVLGCNLHLRGPDVLGRKKLFDLHEIFKTLPSVVNEDAFYPTKVKPENVSTSTGLWDLADDVLSDILCLLSPRDLISVSSTCCHLRSLAASIMPCMKLKLFPHQRAAVQWMLKREHDSVTLPHPLFMDFSTQDGFPFYMNMFSGDIVTNVAPTLEDFHGGMFCDEPGLGKTITALSLILKTQGTLAEPPHGVDIVWCPHDPYYKCGYYEVSAESCSSVWKRFSHSRRRQSHGDNNSEHRMADTSNSPPGLKRAKSERLHRRKNPSSRSIKSSAKSDVSWVVGDFCPVQRNLMGSFEKYSRPDFDEMIEDSGTPRAGSNSYRSKFPKRCMKSNATCDDSNDTWAQCDACRKWRKLPESAIPDPGAAWFCSMNGNPQYKSCTVPEESWDTNEAITYLPGFYTKGTSGGNAENISFFIGVLREKCMLIHSETRKALDWLVNLPERKLLEMETSGLTRPVLDTHSRRDADEYQKIFLAFGLVRKIEKGVARWYYPPKLENLVFDVVALRMALTKPVDLFRFYLSYATLVVVPANLVEHWKTQIQRHVRPGQLRVCLWTDHHKLSAHSLAWDYDVVITTFNRLSVEWGAWRKSVLMQVHWLRVILDEGHTLGSSLSLTNKLQMAISMKAKRRWILTGTPTPNTPTSQVAHLQPMLKFLHEDAYGQNQESWDNGILKPFEAEMEEGRSRLLQLLRRIMISARKSDLKTIPPCIKKAVFLNFTSDHGKSYNELVVTVRRNILLADWNDPSHVESLLNPKQWRLRSSTIRNVRLSCCVAGHIKVTEVGDDIQETMDALVQKGLDPLSEEHDSIKLVLLHGGDCIRCRGWCRLPIVTPCRHILCLDCVALSSEKCTFPGCGNLYEMQRPELLARPENPNPKWAVPKDLIELQPSYKQDAWNPDWHATSSSKVAYLVERLKKLSEDVEKLTIAGITFAGMYSPMHASNKMKSLSIFQNDANCMALLMDGSAALGLDLSFVTHVFLMEPIWDRSMEEQVISRAHRMGALRPIHVETLAMRGTIEEQMINFLQSGDAWRNAVTQEFIDIEETKAHRTMHDFAGGNYLSQLASVSVIGTD